MVFKKGQCYDLVNYRTVSLTCIYCKILEHIIVSNVIKHVGANKILTDCQHGFRARGSCETQLVTLIYDLASTLDKGTQMDMVALDFSKAFDRVPTMAYKGLRISEYHPSCLTEHSEWLLRVEHQTAYQYLVPYSSCCL